MSSEAPSLTPAILDEFRAALVHAGAPLGTEIQPGLNDEQIDQLGKELRVDVPAELRTLWRWGQAPTAKLTPGSWEVNPEFELWPASQAIRETEQYRLGGSASRHNIALGGPRGEGFLLVEGDRDSPSSRVTYAFIEDPDTLVAAPSIGALVQLWTHQLADGEYRYLDGQWDPLDGPLVIIPGDD